MVVRPGRSRASEAWPQEKINYWCKSGGAPPRQVFTRLADVAPEQQKTSEIVAATGLPLSQVRSVFAALGKRTKRNARLRGPWPVHARWNGIEVAYSMPVEIAKRWQEALRSGL